MATPALVDFNTQTFDNPNDLKAFVTTDPTVTSIVAIVCDSSGKYVLFYRTTAEPE